MQLINSYTLRRNGDRRPYAQSELLPPKNTSLL